MKASILGFWLYKSELVTLKELFEYLKARGGEATAFDGYERLIFVGETPKYFTGLFLTSKTHKRFCELLRSDKSMTINVRQAQEGSSLIDFNFFVVNKDTGRGLYQYYHNSCRCQKFVKFCATEYAALSDARRDAEIAAKGDKITDKQREEITKKFSNVLTCGILVRPESFAALVNKFKSIRGFEFHLSTVMAEKEQRFRGLQGKARRIQHSVTFEREIETAERAKAVLDFIKGESEIGEAKVKGVSTDGLEKTIALYDNPDSFGNYEFDKLAENMDFDPKNFATSVFMEEMIRVADSQDKVLGTPVK